ncbi:M90 family metallopeptidase [Thioalkalicoccus limnaeus]|uniref:M90 family metallopeptidase n=1 Tax=Thioalkalicoccus limnaeus TaxID=120681 RepID=A0ABV4BF17_9GAMM
MIRLHRWWRQRTLERARKRYDDADWRAAWDRLPLLDDLTSDEAASLCDLAVLFLRDKAIETAQGIALTDSMRLTIALQACLPILHLGLHWYSDWYAVILYPAEFRPKHEHIDEDGLVWVDDQPMSGEAWERGPVILSWEDVIAGGERDGYNLVIHEFAHKLDMRNGVANGHPPLHSDMNDREWAAAWSAAYDDLCQRVDAGDETSIDPYGAESPAEFFAVCSEAFFEIPTQLRDDYPRVYEQLARFYRQDPAARFR